MYVCLWIYWLVNKQASVITCGEVAERWHKAASSVIERKWEREKERVFLTAVRLSLTLTSCLRPSCHPSCWQMKRPRSLMSQRFVLLHKISAVTSDSLLVILTESWRCILSRYASFSQAEQQDKWSEISWNTSCAFLNPISALNNFLRSRCVQIFLIPSWMLLFVFHSPTRISFLKGYTKVTSAASL